MRHLTEKLEFATRLALLCLLLGAQSLSLVHDFDHLGHPGQPECATCSIGGGLSGPVHVEHETWEPEPELSTDDAPVVGLQPLRNEIPPPSRGPPHLS